MASKKSKSFPWSQVGSAAFGAALGGVLGMLFAPQSGKKTRAALASEGRKVARSTRRTARQLTVQAEKVATRAIASRTSTGRSSATRTTRSRATAKKK